MDFVTRVSNHIIATFKFLFVMDFGFLNLTFILYECKAISTETIQITHLFCGVITLSFTSNCFQVSYRRKLALNKLEAHICICQAIVLQLNYRSHKFCFCLTSNGAFLNLSVRTIVPLIRTINHPDHLSLLIHPVTVYPSFYHAKFAVSQNFNICTRAGFIGLVSKTFDLRF